MQDGSLSAPQSDGKLAGRRTSAVVTLVVVLVLVLGAWYVGAREGFGQIGGGGQNLKLLPRIGQPAPDITVPLADGSGVVRLSDYRGRPVWLNFWGSWCPPCRAEFPDLQAAYVEALQPNNVALLAISLNEPASAADGYAKRNGGTFTILSDPDRSLTGGAYPIANFPTHILVDKDGIVRDIILAPIDKEEIIAAAQKIIAPADAD